MRVFLQLLRVAFWLHPLQRALTAAGAAIILVALVNTTWNIRFNLPGSTLPMLFNGAALILLLPMLLGGAWLRVLSMPRAIQLLPHARGRLLAGTLLIMMLATALWIAAYWAAFQVQVQRYGPYGRPPAGTYLFMYMLTLTFATQCVIAAFIASRGPVWMLVTLAAWTAPHLLLPLFDFDASLLLAGPVGMGTVLLTWVCFCIWYLKVRRIGGQGWARGAIASPALAASDAPALTRESATHRWLLGSGTPLSMGLQWTLGVAVLVGVQLLLIRDSALRAVVVYGTLSGSALVIAAIGLGVAARSRALWLPSGCQREELFRHCESLLLRMATAILLPFLLVGVVLWQVLPEPPSLPASYVFAAVLAPGITAIWFGVALVRRSAMLAVAAGLVIAAGWYYGLVQPLAQDSDVPRWPVFAVQLAAAASLRAIAARRWRSLDWPRGGRMLAERL